MNVATSCQFCGRITAEIRTVEIMRLTFLIAVVFYRTETLTGCPQCVRRLILSRTLADLPAANLLWPIVACLNGLDYLKTWQTNTNWHELSEEQQRAQIARRRLWGWLFIALIVITVGCGTVALIPASIYLRARNR